MTVSRMSQAIDQLRSVVLRDSAEPSDGQLLESYVCSREEAALGALVYRHGPMVWGVCRRLLINHHDAEDAFQATFLVLVRKAGSIRPREKVGNWLYGVARQTSLKARSVSAKRHAREKQVADLPEPAIPPTEPANDLSGFLDEALVQLPEKYRSVLVLCELEGKALKQVAGQLGLPEGTVASRLARGRDLLAKRLARHALNVSIMSLTTFLAQQASATVPPAVVSAAVKTISQASVGALSGGAAALAQGVIKAMFLAKLGKWAAALLFAIVLSAAGYAAYSKVAGGQEENTSNNAPAKQPEKEQADVRLIGTWDVISVKTSGSKIRWLVDAEDIIFSKKTKFRGKMIPSRVLILTKDGMVFTLKYTLNLSTQPRGFDLFPDVPRGGEGELPFQGIYRLDGNSLTICLGTTAKEARPAEFKLKEGTSRIVLFLKRKAEGNNQPKLDPQKDQPPKKDPNVLDLRFRKLNDDDLKQLPETLEGLLMRGRLGYGSNTVTDEGIKHLTRFKKLRILAAGGLSLTDRALETIGKLTTLEELSLDSNKITGTGLRHLAGLKKLRRLDLNYNKLDPASIAALADLPELSSLRIQGAMPVDDRLLELTSRLKNLRELQLWENTSAVTDRGLEHLAKLVTLENLLLRGGDKITDAGLAHIAKLARLKSLQLHDLRSVTPDGMTVLGKLTELRVLHIEQIRMDAAAVRSLAHLTKLEDLLLWSVANSQYQLAQDSLAECLGKLRALRIFRTNLPVSSSAIRALARLQDFESITDELFEVSDEDLKHLARLPKLKTIILASDKVTAASLPVLATMKSLQQLYVSEKVRITPEEWTKLGRDSLPNCTIGRFRPPYTVYYEPKH